GIARMGEIAVYLITVPLVAPIIAIALGTVQIEFLQPLVWWPKGLLTSPDFYASLNFFSGAASVTVFAPFLPPGRTYRPLLWAALGAFAILTIATAIPLGILGPETATRLSLPVIFALNTVHTTVLFVQQLSYLTVALMSVFCFVAGAMTLWMTARGLAEITGVGSDLIWSWATAAALYALGVAIISQALTDRTFQWWSLTVGALYVWIIVLFALPSLRLRSRPHAKAPRG
ncbi:MAG TPA: hypothetical protein VFK80_06665, partial [Limnochordia bacterium]|nr:hypothetical protein [Limnochordia bacterium]